MMTNKYWNKKINNNFNNAAHCYSNYSLVQKYFANKLLNIIKELDNFDAIMPTIPIYDALWFKKGKKM